jgi:hypothetical protein
MAENVYVYTNNGTPVLAKYLTYNGATCYGADGNPYVVAADFSLENFVTRYRYLGAPIIAELQSSLNNSYYGSSAGSVEYAMERYEMAVCHILQHNFPPSAPDDLQRNYNGYTAHDGTGFVKAFTPAASFVFGVASAILEVPEIECEAGGGLINLKARFSPRTPYSGAWERVKEYAGLILTWGHHDINISGFLGNNPNNLPNIEQGYNFVKRYGLDQYY